MIASFKAVHSPQKDAAILTITPPSLTIQGQRIATNICVVLDVSGSMDASADINPAEPSGLTVLDLCKHAVKTIVKSLSTGDTFSLVTFSTNAKVVIEPTRLMTNSNIESLFIDPVSKIQTESSTNLWAGLELGLQTFNANKYDSGNNHLILLTDGFPNVRPMHSEPQTFAQFIRNNGGSRKCQAHFCGFGYSLESQLLFNLASVGRGFFNYIPDCTILGSIFVNLMTTIFQTYASENVLTIEYDPPFTQTKASLEYFRQSTDGEQENIHTERLFKMSTLSTNVIKVKVSHLQYDTPHTLILPPVNVVEGTILRIHYSGNRQHLSKNAIEYFVVPMENGCGGVWTDEMDAHVQRLALVNTIERGVQLSVRDVNRTNLPMEILQVRKSLEQNPSTLAKALLKDITGQIETAISDKAFYTKWGAHYFQSLACAHRDQRCNNFKDGVSVYESQNCKIISKAIEDIFVDLPLVSSGNTHVPPTVYASEYTGSTYFDATSSVCIHGSCNVRLADRNETRKVKWLCPGMRVATRDENGKRTEATIELVVRSRSRHLCEIGPYVKLTPYHPVLTTNEGWQFADEGWQFANEGWQFAKDLSTCDVEINDSSNDDDIVYNFHLSNGHVLFLENGDGKADVMVATLAHGFEDIKVIRHPFFGTSKVLDALGPFQTGASICGFFYERVFVVHGVKRDTQTNLVCGFV